MRQKSTTTLYVWRDQKAGHAVCCIHAQQEKDQNNDVHNRSRASTHLVNPDPTLSVSKAAPIPHNNNREDRNPIRKNVQQILLVLCTFAFSPPPPLPTQGAPRARGPGKAFCTPLNRRLSTLLKEA